MSLTVALTRTTLSVDERIVVTMQLPRLPQSCASPKLLNPFVALVQAAAVIVLGLGPKCSSRVEGFSLLISLLALCSNCAQRNFFCRLFCCSVKGYLLRAATRPVESLLPLISDFWFQLRRYTHLSCRYERVVTRWRFYFRGLVRSMSRTVIDPFHKWLPIINYFVSIKIILTNLLFNWIILKNFCSRLERLI